MLLGGATNGGKIPIQREWFYPFAALDLDQRYGTPFSSFYGLCSGESDCISYPTSTSVTVPWNGDRLTLDDFDPINARHPWARFGSWRSGGA